MNAIIKRYENVLQNNTILKELFRTNLLIVISKRAKKLGELVARANRFKKTRIF